MSAERRLFYSDENPCPPRPASRIKGARKRVLLLKLAEAQNWRCCYCHRLMTVRVGPLMLTIEHVTPICDGGAVHWGNCAAACLTCNSLRHAPMTGTEIKDWVANKAHRHMAGWRNDFNE